MSLKRIKLEIKGLGSFDFRILNNKEIELLKFENERTIKELEIPSEVEGRRVTVLSSHSLSFLKLEKVTLPKYLKEMKKNCLSGNRIRKIFIPKTVRDISPQSFLRNPLEEIIVDPDNKKYRNDIGGGLYEGDNLAIGTQTGVIADGTKEIKESAFSGVDLTGVTVSIPGSIRTIGEGAFYCEREAKGVNLSRIIFRKGLEEVKERAFKNNLLTELKLPETLTKIGKRAFKGNKIKALTIPDSVKELQSLAFYCNEIKELNIGKGLGELSPMSFSNNKIKKVTIPKNIKEIKATAFSRNKIKDFHLEDPETILHSVSFGWNELKVIDLPKRLAEPYSLISSPFLGNSIKTVFVQESFEGSIQNFLDTKNVEKIYILDKVIEKKFEVEEHVDIQRVTKRDFENLRKLYSIL